MQSILVYLSPMQAVSKSRIKILIGPLYLQGICAFPNHHLRVNVYLVRKENDKEAVDADIIYIIYASAKLEFMNKTHWTFGVTTK